MQHYFVYMSPCKCVDTSILSSRECLTSGRLFATPRYPTPNHSPPQVPISWTAVSRDLAREKAPSVALLQGSAWKGEERSVFSNTNLHCCSLYTAPRHTSEGHGCFKMQTPLIIMSAVFNMCMRSVCHVQQPCSAGAYSALRGCAHIQCHRILNKYLIYLPLSDAGEMLRIL